MKIGPNDFIRRNVENRIERCGRIKYVFWIMEIMKEKPRRRSISELLDWRSFTGCKNIIRSENGYGEEHFLENCDKEPETRRRKRSGTWP